MNRQHRERLVAKAMNRFFFQDNLAKNKIKTHRWRPDIVISRDPGSGGRPIAKKIASKLGWQLLDKKIMIKLAAKHGLPAKEFAKIDETSRNWFADTFNLLFNKNYLSDIRYLKHLKLLLMKSAKDGDVVIVGRGANHIIPSDKCLRVRITASFSKRVDNTYKHEKKSSREEAARWVTKVEERRDRFISQYFGVNPHNPWHYDLVINTNELSLVQARNLIISAYLAKFPSERRRLKDKV
jgi:cytidylate kinase